MEQGRETTSINAESRYIITHYSSVSVSNSHLVAVHKDAQDADLVDQSLDGGPAPDAEAEDKVVKDEDGVDHQHRAPPSSPAAQHT